MGTLQDKITSFLIEKGETHHSGDDQVLYVNDYEEAEYLSEEIMKVINDHINEP